MSYIDTALMRTNLTIEPGKHEDKLSEVVAEANQEVEVQLKPFADKIPLETDTVFFGQVRKAALHYARKLWFDGVLQYKLATEEKKLYDDKIEQIKQSYRAERTTRTRAVITAADPRERYLLLPSSRNTFPDLDFP